MSIGTEFVASVSVGDTLWVRACGGVVERVQTEGIADPSTAGLIYFKAYYRGSPRRGYVLVQPVVRVSHSGSFEDCLTGFALGSLTHPHPGCAVKVSHQRAS